VKAANPSLLGEDGERNAHGRPPKLILPIELPALVHQEFNDITQSLIGKGRSELQRALLKQSFPDFLLRWLS
jgi:hypothetical protein